MNQLHYNQEKSPKRTPANAARKAFWDAAMGDNSKLANLAKAAIAEAEQQAQPDQRVTPEMFKALQDNLDVIARAHNRHVEIDEKYGITGEAQPAREWVELDEKDRLDILQNSADEFDALELTAKKLREKNAGLPAADDKAGGEPVAWRELCRRLYVELFHCDQQMTSGPRPKWTQGATVRDVLRDAKEALETHPQPQAEAVSPDKAQNFYLAVCNFLVWIGREGIVHADDPIIDQLSNALHDIDGGVFKDSLKWPQAEVRVPEKKK